jgi:hypothetical protein
VGLYRRRCPRLLHLAPLPSTGVEPLIPVDLVCPHFLAAVNAALNADFSTDEFDIMSCEGCQPTDEPEPQLAGTP